MGAELEALFEFRSAERLLLERAQVRP